MSKVKYSKYFFNGLIIIWKKLEEYGEMSENRVITCNYPITFHGFEPHLKYLKIFKLYMY